MGILYLCTSAAAKADANQSFTDTMPIHLSARDLICAMACRQCLGNSLPERGDPPHWGSESLHHQYAGTGSDDVRESNCVAGQV